MPSSRIFHHKPGHDGGRNGIDETRARTLVAPFVFNQPGQSVRPGGYARRNNNKYLGVTTGVMTAWLITRSAGLTN
jgi:hypothetical protein